MNKPLISVCMLCYNHEQFVAEAVKSILNQTYKNWELIIVDNASIDNSKKIIEDVIKDDERITFLPQKSNKFVSIGFNTAIKQSLGEYIAIVSADDNFVSEKLEQQLKYMQEKDLDLSFTWVSVIDSQSKEGDQEVQKWFNQSQAKNAYDILREYFSMHTVTYAPTAMIKSSTLQNMYLHDHRLLQTQDLEFWIRILEKTQKVEILHEKLTNYRILDNGGNLSANNSPTKLNRTNFEMIYVWKQLFSIDNKILSKVFDTDITEKNKYQVIYHYLERYDVFTRQLTVLLDVFEKLGHDCDVTSAQFQFFFEEYARFGIVESNVLAKKEESIVWLEGQLESHQKTLKEKEEGIVWLEGQLESHQKTLKEKEEGIVWLQEQLVHCQQVLKEKEGALQYKGTFKWFANKILGRE